MRRVNFNSHPILMEFHQERLRAHELHSEDSAEEKPWWHSDIFRTWIEEVMETIQAHALCDDRSDEATIRAMRSELIQVGAMTELWVQALDDDLRRRELARTAAKAGIP